MLILELRLVSPAESETLDAAADASGNMKYQLTHDYLVPSLRSWLMRKQKATRRGRPIAVGRLRVPLGGEAKVAPTIALRVPPDLLLHIAKNME